MLPTADGNYWPLGATDGNAVFGHSGMFHVMHQTPNRTSTNPSRPTDGYWASWGHVVSEDLAHFQRVDNALDPDFNSTYDFHDGDCDGTVSFVPADAVNGGVVMTFGPDCARGVITTDTHHNPHDRSAPPRLREHEGDAPRVGIARLVDPSDRELSRWSKDRDNPIAFASGSPPCAFSGKVWRHGNNWSMICAVNSLGNAWGRYTTADSSLHGPWQLVDSSFATFTGPPVSTSPCTHPTARPPCPVGSISAPSFLPLTAYPGKQTYTHIINAGGGRAYVLGVYDDTMQKLNASGAVQVCVQS